MLRLIIGLLFLNACAHTNPIRNIEKGNEYVKKGLYNEAYSHYKIAIKKDANSYVAKTNAGIVLAKMGDCKNAIYYLKSALTQKPNSFEANYYIANCLTSTNQFRQALRYAAKAKKAKHTSIRAINLMAWLYINLKKPQRALNILKKLPVRKKNNVASSLLKSKAFMLKRKYNAALKELKLALKKTLNPNDKSYVLSTLGDLYLEKRDYKRSSYFHKKSLSLRPFGYESLIGLGVVQLQSKRHKKALRYLSQAIKIDKNKPIAYYYMGKLYEKTNPSLALQYHKRFIINSVNIPVLAKQIDSSKKAMNKIQQTKRRVRKKTN